MSEPSLPEVSPNDDRCGRSFPSVPGETEPLLMDAGAWGRLLENSIAADDGGGGEDYAILRGIGSGGQGSVYEAVENSTRRRVAIKFLRPRDSSPVPVPVQPMAPVQPPLPPDPLPSAPLSPQPASAEGRGGTGHPGPDGAAAFLPAHRDPGVWRLHREAEAVSRLNHPHIVKLLRADFPAEGAARLVMEFVDGGHLGIWAERPETSLTAKLGLFARICDAMAYAHTQGILHRDLKPGNILVEKKGADFEPKIVDFGLAYFMNDASVHATLTETGQVPGTPLFVSPEQARGDRLAMDHLGDIYSLGVILFHLITGDYPCAERSSHAGIIRAIGEGRLRAPRAVKPDLDRDLDAILCKATAFHPASRYPSASALADDLRAFLENRPVSARHGSRLYVWRKHFRRHWRAAAWTTVLLGAAGVAAAWHLREIARRNALAATAYHEARSLLEFQLTDTVGWLRDAGRHDVVALIADRALTFPWDLPVPPDPARHRSRSATELLAITAGLEADAYERGHDPATALQWREKALAYARQRALSEPGNSAAAWDVLEAEGGLLINRISLGQIPAGGADTLDWLRRGEALVSAHPEHAVSWINTASFLVTQLAPLLSTPESRASITSAIASLIKDHDALPPDQKLIIAAALAEPRLLQAEAELALAAATSPNAGSAAAAAAAAASASASAASAASAAWQEFLTRFPRHVDGGGGLIRTTLLQSRCAMASGQPADALDFWRQARGRLAVMEQNFLFSGGSALMESLFADAIPIAGALQKTGQNPETVHFFKEEIIPLFEAMNPLIPAERKRQDPGASGIPDLWPLLLEGQLVSARALLATGPPEKAFEAFMVASATSKSLIAWFPKNPLWLTIRCEALLPLPGLPFPPGVGSTPDQVRNLIRSLADKAEALHPDAACQARLQTIRSALNG